MLDRWCVIFWSRSLYVIVLLLSQWSCKRVSAPVQNSHYMELDSSFRVLFGTTNKPSPHIMPHLSSCIPQAVPNLPGSSFGFLISGNLPHENKHHIYSIIRLYWLLTLVAHIAIATVVAPDAHNSILIFDVRIGTMVPSSQRVPYCVSHGLYSLVNNDTWYVRWSQTCYSNAVSQVVLIILVVASAGYPHPRCVNFQVSKTSFESSTWSSRIVEYI